jgi:hypothetical protein
MRMEQTIKEKYGGKVRKWRMGKLQIERDLLLVEMLKVEGNYVIKVGDHMTEASIYGCMVIE